MKYKNIVTIKLIFTVYGTGQMSVAREEMVVQYLN
jgi:hypothetical protein